MAWHPTSARIGTDMLRTAPQPSELTRARRRDADAPEQARRLLTHRTRQTPRQKSVFSNARLAHTRMLHFKGNRATSTHALRMHCARKSVRSKRPAPWSTHRSGICHPAEAQGARGVVGRAPRPARRGGVRCAARLSVSKPGTARCARRRQEMVIHAIKKTRM